MAPIPYRELVEQYGSAERIPDLELYRYITDPIIKKDLLKRYSENPTKFYETALVQDVRRRSKQNLFWLHKYFLWPSSFSGVGKPIEHSKVTEETHRVLCDFFVKKDDSRPFDEQDNEFKTRMVLYPRGSFKSTTDVSDCVQWILNFPDIRILYLTATDPMAEGFVDETKGHFVIRHDDPSPMNIFFPEFCLDEKKLGASGEFTCPLWAKKQVKRKEPTIMARGIGSAMAGLHFEVAKVDDVVNEENSASELMCNKIIHAVDTNLKMVMPYGFIDFLGTRYSDDDYYGVWIEKNNVGPVEIISGLDRPEKRPWTITINRENKSKLLLGTGWKLKPEAEEQLLKGILTEEKLGEEHYYILFPENLPFSELRRQQRHNERVFEAQINQNPRPRTRVAFDRPLLLRHTVPYNQLPLCGPIVVTWDFAFSEKKKRDYSTAAVGIYNDKGQLFIIDLIRQRFNHTSLAQAVVDLAQKWRPHIYAIENASGSKFLEPTILVEAHRRGNPEILKIVAGIDWFTPENNKDAKRQRMASMHPWLVNDRLFFASHLPHLETLYDEFERCLSSHKRDDIPDVISQQMRYAPRVQIMIAKNEVPMGVSKEDAANNIIFGHYGDDGPIPSDAWGQPYYGPATDLTEPLKDEEPPQPMSNGMDPILGSGLIG